WRSHEVRSVGHSTFIDPYSLPYLNGARRVSSKRFARLALRPPSACPHETLRESLSSGFTLANKNGLVLFPPKSRRSCSRRCPMRSTLVAALLLLISAPLAYASANTPKIEGYLDFRKGKYMIVDGQRVVTTGSTTVKGAKDASSIPLGWAMRVRG